MPYLLLLITKTSSSKELSAHLLLRLHRTIENELKKSQIRIPRFWKTTKHEMPSLTRLYVLPFMPAFVLVFSFLLFRFLLMLSHDQKVNIWRIWRIWRILNPEQNKHEVNDEIIRYVRSPRNTVPTSSLGGRRHRGRWLWLRQLGEGRRRFGERNKL